ncbi:MAG TPA: hypothetical protein VF525_00675 [Pyrinomonadaceae bacterium]|jgi:hypothetical protein
MDYLLIGLIVSGLFVVGLACVVWPERMRWQSRGILTLFLPERLHIALTRGAGALVVIFSLFLLFKLLTSR